MTKTQHAVKILLFQDSDFDHVGVGNVLRRSSYTAIDVHVHSSAALDAQIDAEVSTLILQDDEKARRINLVLELLGEKALDIPVLVIVDHYADAIILGSFTQGMVGYLAKHEISRIPKLLGEMQTYLAGTRYRQSDTQTHQHH